MTVVVLEAYDLHHCNKDTTTKLNNKARLPISVTGNPKRFKVLDPMSFMVPCPKHSGLGGQLLIVSRDSRNPGPRLGLDTLVAVLKSGYLGGHALAKSYLFGGYKYMVKWHPETLPHNLEDYITCNSENIVKPPSEDRT
ncbi:hypothetical protein TIFTF001_022915 [Ficus carica]|uniref:Uncharacterized protein n=1 Tax=Ficus carica TaxID=3494 RepID=A0AA88DEY0_FICCA|nr:hypothetical protein TIFTF001_022915 [Ficus carica]